MTHYYLLYFVVVGVFFVEAIAFYAAWRLNESEYGTRDWAIYAAIIATGTGIVNVGFMLNSHVDPFAKQLSESLWYLGTVANGTAFYFLWRGVRRFLGEPKIPGVTAFNTLLVCTVGVTAHGVFGLPNSWLAMLISIIIGAFCSLIFLTFQRSHHLHHSLRVIMLITFGYMALLWGARGIAIFLDPTRDHHGAVDSVVIYMSILVSILNACGLILLTNERLHQRLRTQATRDPLTGLLNRRAFLDISQSLIAHANRHQLNVGIALLDLDHFKRVNDEYGHLAGDHALKRFGELVRQCLREEDTICRYGGEEFVALLPDVTPVELRNIMERIRREVAQQADHELPTTVSIGSYLCAPDSLRLQEMIATADRALYSAKRAGRNQVATADLTDPSPA
ncbi:GGDEF domain-containing protein [Simiduia aestuariiviva]|uniref:diguanylate cyclase n=1 Tax=Simiduia aestuariiviva TaxID=1510459 RepID=A0A839UHZ0_9GAMM|nr:GGDEF domain-containing protein [Simiduia aestuariiviva]MBB3167654.1 diguanylate cyclase (GGDEF)-like protein [Simiduia aestuariiviva]